MSTQLTQIKTTALQESGFTDDQVKLIKQMIAPNATDNELKLFLHQAKKMGLDPLAKQIYFQKYKNNKTGEDKMTVIVSIDGYRLTADRTGLYAGSDDYVFDDEKTPTKATVTVYKMVGGVRCPFTASAHWDAYYPGDYKGKMWQRMPNLMLGKVAEALALRKAFPAELAGVYTPEEMDQAPRAEAKEAPMVEAEFKERSVENTGLQDRIQKMLTAFDAIGVSLDEIENYLVKKMKDFTDADLEQLKEFYRARKSMP